MPDGARSRGSTGTGLLLAVGLACVWCCQAAPGAGQRAFSHQSWYPQQLERSEPRRLPGPFLCSGMVFYIVHHGGPLTVSLDVSRPGPELRNNGGVRVPHAVFWQLYDADERPLEQQYHRFTDDSELVKRFKVELGESPGGVYQVRSASSPASFIAVDLQTEPPCSFGIMPTRCRLGRAVPAQFSEAYVYAPPGAGDVTLRSYATTVLLRDEAGKQIGSSQTDGGKGTVTPGNVYQLSVSPASATGTFGITGMPGILCPDAVTARNIRGSAEVAPDGRMLSHKFQLRMWQWMHSLEPADLAVSVAALTATREEWLKDPRHAGLLGLAGPFNHIAKILRTQDVDPRSPTYGKGISASWLGPAYVIDKPFNPYRRNLAVLNRLLLGEFAVLLELHENGTFDANNWNHYCGVDGLTYGKRAFQFGYVAPVMADAALRELWFEGVSSSPNRWAFGRVSCENQTSSFAAHLYSLFMGSGREVYRTLAHDFAAALLDPALNDFMKTGYTQEAYGPDATYQGLCAAEIAFYFKLSRDEAAKAGLRKIYDLLNHTVAPEPDGQVRGASSFSHRTAGSWRNRQYNAGFRLMSDELPEAGVWCPEQADRAAYDATCLASIEERLGIDWDDAWYESNIRWLDSYAYHPWLEFFHRYMYPYRELARGTWPALQSEHFDKNVNDEFFFIRRPGYYAAVYTGSTRHEWVKASRQPDPCPSDSGREGTVLTVGKRIWQPTQGLCMFWTPQYGNAVLGKNWNVYTANIVRADLPEGRVSWPDYWGFGHGYDAGEHVLRLDWEMIELPLHVSRTLQFTEEGMRQTLQLRASAGVTTVRLVEQIPFLEKAGQAVLFRRGAGWSEEPGADCRSAWVGGETGAGVQIAFDSPVRAQRGPSSAGLGHRMGLLEVELPSGYAADERAELAYTLRAAIRPE